MTKEHEFPGREVIYELFFNKDHEIESIEKFVSSLASYFSIAPEQSTLVDIGCGIGRMLPSLSAAGWKQLVGVEPDPDYLTHARQKLPLHRYPGLSLSAGAFDSLPGVESFDLMIAINSPFYYQLSPKKRRESLSYCASRLRPGGVLFLDITNFLFAMKHYQQPSVQEEHWNEYLIRRWAKHSVDVIQGHWIHTDFQQLIYQDEVIREQEEEFTFTFILWPELQDMLYSAGFSRLETYESFNDREPHPLSEKRIMVAAVR